MIDSIESHVAGALDGDGGDGSGSNTYDACSLLDRVYPLSNVTSKNDSGYQEQYQLLVKKMFATDKGSDLYAKIKGKTVYFIEAASKECFYSDHLSNINPCRFSMGKSSSHDFICLTSSSNFEVLTLYGQDGWKIADIIEKRQMYEDRIDESKEEVKSVYWNIDSPVDFFVEEILMVDETGEQLDNKNIGVPHIISGKYENLDTATKSIFMKDGRPAYIYDHRNRRNSVSQRKVTILVKGSQGEVLQKNLVLKGMEKLVKVSFKQAYSINKLNITTDINFDKWRLNEKELLYPPHFVDGKTVLYAGAGMPIGSYKIVLIGADNELSQPYRTDKATKNGIIEITFDLSNLDSGHWDSNVIAAHIKSENNKALLYLQKKVVGEIINYLEKLNSAEDRDALAAIMQLTSSYKNMLVISQELAGESIPFIGGICSAIDLAVSNIRAIEKAIEKRIVYAQRANHINNLKNTLREIEIYKDREEEEKNMQLVWDYYKKKTKGDATSKMIITDIETQFRKITGQ